MKRWRVFHGAGCEALTKAQGTFLAAGLGTGAWGQCPEAAGDRAWTRLELDLLLACGGSKGRESLFWEIARLSSRTIKIRPRSGKNVWKKHCSQLAVVSLGRGVGLGGGGGQEEEKRLVRVFKCILTRASREASFRNVSE